MYKLQFLLCIDIQRDVLSVLSLRLDCFVFKCNYLECGCVLEQKKIVPLMRKEHLQVYFNTSVQLLEHYTTMNSNSLKANNNWFITTYCFSLFSSRFSFIYYLTLSSFLLGLIFVLFFSFLFFSFNSPTK